MVSYLTEKSVLCMLMATVSCFALQGAASAIPKIINTCFDNGTFFTRKALIVFFCWGGSFLGKATNDRNDNHKA